MPLDADAIVDRRKLRRKLSFWRVIAFAALIAAIIVAGSVYSGFSKSEKYSDHIAKLPITGFISEDLAQLELISEIAEEDSVKGVIVSINSPGGGTAGSEAIYNELRKVAEKKPIVAQIGTLGTSGGYMVALASDHIIARRNSITGSIGVLFQYGNLTELLGKIGISVDSVKSSTLKAEPNFYEPTPEEAKTMLAELVNDMYDWFVNLVAERRSLSYDEAKKLSDGRIYSGSKALELGLVDAIGDQKTAVDWLVEERNIEEDLPIVEWLPEYESESLLFSDSVALFISKVIRNILFGSSNKLSGINPMEHTMDGMLSIWHVPLGGQGLETQGKRQ